MLQCADLSAVPVTAVELIGVHQPGSAADWAAVASELARRWKAQRPRAIRVYWASARAIRLLGGRMSGRLPPLDAITHDLGVFAVAQHLFRENPALRAAWIPEELFADVYRQAKPDGGLASERGLHCFTEFCGMYTEERLTRLARLSEDTNVPLHLWTVTSPKHSGGSP
jgi:hypothetical protein